MLEFLKEGFKDFKKNYYENDKSYIDNLVKSGQKPKKKKKQTGFIKKTKKFFQGVGNKLGGAVVRNTNANGSSGNRATSSRAEASLEAIEASSSRRRRAEASSEAIEASRLGAAAAIGA